MIRQLIFISVFAAAAAMAALAYNRKNEMCKN